MQRASSKCAHTSGISVCSPPPPPVLSSSQSTTTGGSARPSTAREVNKPYTCQQAVHMSTSYYTRTAAMSRGAGGGHISRFASGALATSESCSVHTGAGGGQLVPINRSSALQPAASGLMVTYTLLMLLPPALMLRCLAALLSQAPRRMTAPRSASTPQTVQCVSRRPWPQGFVQQRQRARRGGSTDLNACAAAKAKGTAAAQNLRRGSSRRTSP
jgi:hypothetical protein